MRRFRSTRSVTLRTAAGGRLDAWVAETPWRRLTGLALGSALPSGRALLIPACRSVHTAGMRFGIDVAFVTWPPAPGCEVVCVEPAVPPLRVVTAARGVPRGSVAALEAAAGALAALRVRPGCILSTDPVLERCGLGTRIGQSRRGATDVREIPKTQRP